MTNYIPYYRVSTKDQGDSGLGLEAQRKSVLRYIGEGSPNEGNILGEYTEVESGRKNDRPELTEAIEQCLLKDATLVIAKLDRLSRNALFTLSLLNSKVKFIAVDMPEANELTIGILAVMAQDEAKRISERTKSALAVKKEQLAKEGLKLGTPGNLTAISRANSIESRRKTALKQNQMSYAMIKACNGKSLGCIADDLNEGGFKTSKGNRFTPSSIKRVRELYEDKR